MVGVPAAGPPERADAWTTTGDVLEDGRGPAVPPRWTGLPPAVRRAVVALLVLALLGAGVLWLRDQARERELGRRVALAFSLGVQSSSTSPPGGSLTFFVAVRNEGDRPVWIESLTAGDGGLRVRLRENGARRVDPAQELAVPLSALLSCRSGGLVPGRSELPAEVTVRREDGGSTVRRPDLEGALLLDVAATACRVRPDLVDEELSGPVLDDR